MLAYESMGEVDIPEHVSQICPIFKHSFHEVAPNLSKTQQIYVYQHTIIN